MKSSESMNQKNSKLLIEEFTMIQEKLGVTLDLNIVWKPNAYTNLSGEVKGNNIFIYDETEDKALDTLRHESVDYYISQIIEPYKEVTNRLIRMVNDDAYKKKEKVVEAIVRALSQPK